MRFFFLFLNASRYRDTQKETVFKCGSRRRVPRLRHNLKTVRLRSTVVRDASWPKGDCAVASNASVVRHIVFRPLLAFGDSRLRSKLSDLRSNKL